MTNKLVAVVIKTLLSVTKYRTLDLEMLNL